MLKADVCDLIQVSPAAEGVGIERTETRRRVYCTIRSIGMQEAYQAMGLGLNPEKRLLIPYEKDYAGERELEYEGERWKVLRVAGNEYNGVLLTIQRIAGNAVEIPPEPEPDPDPDEPVEAGV